MAGCLSICPSGQLDLWNAGLVLCRASPWSQGTIFCVTNVVFVFYVERNLATVFLELASPTKTFWTVCILIGRPPGPGWLWVYVPTTTRRSPPIWATHPHVYPVFDEDRFKLSEVSEKTALPPMQETVSCAGDGSFHLRFPYFWTEPLGWWNM